MAPFNLFASPGRFRVRGLEGTSWDPILLGPILGACRERQPLRTTRGRKNTARQQHQMQEANINPGRNQPADTKVPALLGGDVAAGCNRLETAKDKAVSPYTGM